MAAFDESSRCVKEREKDRDRPPKGNMNGNSKVCKCRQTHWQSLHSIKYSYSTSGLSVRGFAPPIVLLKSRVISVHKLIYIYEVADKEFSLQAELVSLRTDVVLDQVDWEARWCEQGCAEQKEKVPIVYDFDQYGKSVAHLSACKSSHFGIFFGCRRSRLRRPRRGGAGALDWAKLSPMIHCVQTCESKWRARYSEVDSAEPSSPLPSIFSFLPNSYSFAVLWWRGIINEWDGI